MKRQILVVLCILMACATVLSLFSCNLKGLEEVQLKTAEEQTEEKTKEITQEQQSTEEEKKTTAEKKPMDTKPAETEAPGVTVAVQKPVMDTKTDSEKLWGTWESSFDLTSKINESFRGTELEGMVQVKSFSLNMSFVFRQDGTYKMFISESALKDALAGVKADMVAGMTEYFTQMLAQNGQNISLEELLAANGTTIEKLVEDSFTEESLTALLSSSQEEGQYLAENGKLYLSSSVDTQVSRSVYYTYKLSDTELRFTGGSADLVAAERENGVPLPWTFRKAS